VFPSEAEAHGLLTEQKKATETYTYLGGGSPVNQIINQTQLQTCPESL